MLNASEISAAIQRIQGWQGLSVETLAAAIAERVNTPSTPLCFCGLPTSKNPHLQAGEPEKVLTVGAVYECIPCLTKSRHDWSVRASKAERQLRADHGEDVPMVTKESALEAIEHVEQHNGPGRASEAKKLLIPIIAAASQKAGMSSNPEHTLFNEIRVSTPVSEDGEPVRYLITEQQLQRIRALEAAIVRGCSGHQGTYHD